MSKFLTVSLLGVSSFTASTQSPISMALSLILFALILALTSWTIFSKWVGLAIIMLFIGGMMVVFLYVTSISASLKFLNTNKWFPLIPLFACLGGLTPPSGLNPHYATHPDLILNSPNSSLMIALVLYLLILLFIVVKVSESFKGSLTQKFF